jgi:hypothetical protein
MSHEAARAANNTLFADPKEVQAMLEELCALGGFDSQYLTHWTVSTEGEPHWDSHQFNCEPQPPPLQGVILGNFPRRKRWAGHYEKKSGARRPDCESLDGKLGVGSPGGCCATCTFARVAAGNGRQPACRHYRDLLILRPGLCLPEFVVVPPMSLSAYQRFDLKLAIAGVPKHGVLTSFGLAMARNRREVAYPVVVFNAIRRLTPEELAVAECYVTMFGGLVK